MPSYSDQEIIGLVEDYMHASNNPDQVGYRKQVATREFANKSLFLGSLKRLHKFGDFRSKRILDVGCGFGWQAFVLSLLHEKTSVVGIDILPSMISGMSESLATMRLKGIRSDLTAICGDICDPTLDLGLFDAIYSNEAIEHVHDLQSMFSRCFNLLKPGGMLLLFNDSNALNTKTRDETMAMWRERETSWEWIDKLKNWRPIEHGQAKPFSVMREDIVRQSNPLLDDENVAIVVKNTAGLLKSEIASLAKNYCKEINFPKIGKFDRCRNPETGEYAERLLDPFELAEMLKKSNFRTQVRHWFRRFPLHLANGIQFRPLNNFLFDLRGVFLVVGQKSFN